MAIEAIMDWAPHLAQLERKRGLLTAIDKAKSFVLSNQSSDGSWRDFSSEHHGQSTYWVTGYVGQMTRGCAPQGSLARARRYLMREHRAGDGWGWSEKSVPDTDSTAICLRFLQGSEYSTSLDVEFLLCHQNADGGFGTFATISEKDLLADPRLCAYESFAGWYLSQPEVTATVILTLPDEYSDVKGAVNFLKSTQRSDGSWPAYWATQDVYSTAICVVAFPFYLRKAAAKWLRDKQSGNGSWGDSPFYTAWAIKALLAEGDKKHKSSVRGASEWLLEEQLSDGSWQSPPYIQVPKPNETNLKGLHTDPKTDTKRIFTTATCLSALLAAQYKKVHR